MALVEFWELLDLRSGDERNMAPSPPLSASNRCLCDVVPDRGANSLCHE